MAQLNYKKTNRLDAKATITDKVGLFVDENGVLCSINENGDIEEIEKKVNVYSTSEITTVGEWIDGSPISRFTDEVLFEPGTGNTLKTRPFPFIKEKIDFKVKTMNTFTTMQIKHMSVNIPISRSVTITKISLLTFTDDSQIELEYSNSYHAPINGLVCFDFTLAIYNNHVSSENI